MRTPVGVEQLNIRIPKKLARELEALAEAEHIAKIDIARQLLWEGIARRKQEAALKLYEQGQVSKSRAAEIADLSLWEFTEVVDQRGARWNYNLEEAKQELQRALSDAREGTAAS
jgi:predicted HTH domain antitoxin